MSRPLRCDRLSGLLVAGLVLVGTQQVFDAALIKSKAELARVLIDRAWTLSMEGDQVVKPWPWADTWPVARLSIPDRKVDLPVLYGAQGNAPAKEALKGVDLTIPAGSISPARSSGARPRIAAVG